MPIPTLELVELEDSAASTSDRASGMRSIPMSHRVWMLAEAFLHQECGVRLPTSLEGELEPRLGPLALAHGYSNAHDFVMHSLHPSASITQREVLLDALLPRETGFYREPEFWAEFERAVAPSLSRSAGEVTVWCAGAASGEEVWSLAMTLATAWPTLFRRVKIVGTDVSTHAVLRATGAVYPGAAVRASVSDERVRACLDAHDRDTYRVKDSLRGHVTWRTHNLMGPYPPVRECHAIICRGVLRDMDERDRQEVLDNMITVLRPDGWLGLGLDTDLDGADVTHGWARIA